MHRTSRRRALRATAVLVLAIATVASISQIAFSDDAIPIEPTTSPVTPPDAPASAAVPTDPRCPSGGSWFENTAMHVGLCVPAAWGFTDFTTALPMSHIPAEQLTDLHLLSARAFPWAPGDLPFDVIRARGIVDVEMMVLEAGLTASTECEPSSPRRTATMRVLTCVQAYDPLGMPAASGSLRAVKAIVPLLRTPTPQGPATGLAGARLLIVGRYAATTPREEVDRLWTLIDSIRAF